MKKILFSLLPIFLIMGCASHKKINKLTEDISCDKVFYFTFDESSNFIEIVKKGPTIGDSRIPDYKEEFRKSIQDLAKSSKARLIYSETPILPSDSIVQVIVKIEKIDWNFYFFSAIMETEITYELSYRKINLIGNNKVFWHGTKKGNLFKSLKHGNYLFLSDFCKNTF